VQQLWMQEKRECQYAATDLLLMYKGLWTQETIDLFKMCITQRSWWDTVDDIATNCVGALCLRFPDLIHRVLDLWIKDTNMWLRRSALLFQLKYKQNTGAQRLFKYCAETMHEKEFFIRKAIGWVLREYSKTCPEAVAQFVSDHSSELSSLSKREACKYISH
jgi:3-methyladenine DNA glycosylase AlkD